MSDLGTFVAPAPPSYGKQGLDLCVGTFWWLLLITGALLWLAKFPAVFPFVYNLWGDVRAEWSVASARKRSLGDKPGIAKLELKLLEECERIEKALNVLGNQGDAPSGATLWHVLTKQLQKFLQQLGRPDDSTADMKFWDVLVKHITHAFGELGKHDSNPADTKLRDVLAKQFSSTARLHLAVVNQREAQERRDSSRAKTDGVRRTIGMESDQAQDTDPAGAETSRGESADCQVVDSWLKQCEHELTVECATIDTAQEALRKRPQDAIVDKLQHDLAYQLQRTHETQAALKELLKARKATKDVLAEIDEVEKDAKGTVPTQAISPAD
eukprot:CAMPEP_0204372394 /NCGR_PEP_ID=MMETSP0469-20131031/47252_1 /ASSEMBLY_ACC=CAM_ASM_000384 /TAXON_ID=2969 /ORGANISM="Oxyrrhis marina" /LENGTH=326 /DNA_ID=CAMNT_0051362693 /DNA_START=45 /DNA_END=1025 /DNA_ORIENTATION=-